jgi:hypothetical protein
MTRAAELKLKFFASVLAVVVRFIATFLLASVEQSGDID